MQESGLITPDLITSDFFISVLFISFYFLGFWCDAKFSPKKLSITKSIAVFIASFMLYGATFYAPIYDSSFIYEEMTKINSRFPFPLARVIFPAFSLGFVARRLLV